ncbi:BTB domain-containing protein [Mycena venus]|uniref:BTB domain-containing protein n=1 Tax=Mycena venus TaxID=2733690 RepID=A0A8H6XV58_9AGAR|nr:BTB domain-containing protein [Mycena venus]
MSSPVPEYIASNPSSFVPTHPFDKTAGADAILRSSDGADFYVHRTILSLVSPVFETMFSLPQAESSPAVPIIDLQEGPAVLLSGHIPNVETLDELREVIEVLMKYDMQCQIPVAIQHLEKHYSSRPLAVYAIASRHQWKDVAVAAARGSLKHPLRVLLEDSPPELEGVTAVAYHNLLQYHSRCGEAARLTTTSLKWFLWPATLDNCGCSRVSPGVIFFDNVYHNVPVWFSRYLTDTRDVLTISPGSNIYEIRPFYTALGEGKCNSCRQFNLISFATSQLPAQLKAEIDKIELKF